MANNGDPGKWPDVSAPQARSRYLHPEELQRFENFHVAAQRIVEGFYSGRHRSAAHDASAEFADYRPYSPGDDFRSLDWRAYARTDRDYVKLFRKETDMRCHVLLDTSRSMGFRGIAPIRPRQFSWPSWLRSRSLDNAALPASTEALSKFEYGAHLAAALCYLMIRQGDKASLALGASNLDLYVPPGGAMMHLKGMLHRLDRVTPDGATALSEVLKNLFSLAGRRGLLVVITDLLEDTEPFFRSLGLFAHQGWQVVLFHVLTEDEVGLPGEGPTRYRDAEGSEVLDADAGRLRAAYRTELRKWLSTLENVARERRIHYTRMTASTHYTLALERYLNARERS